MSRPVTTHTVASLHARCDDEGDCWLWTGYMGNGSPYVSHNGKMVAVRKLMLELAGKKTRQTARYFATRCGNPECIRPDHIVARTEAEHMTAIAGRVRHRHPVRVSKLQMAGRSRAGCKLNEAKAQAIRDDPRSCREIALELGVSKALVAKVKRNECWRPTSATVNPWIGLL